MNPAIGLVIALPAEARALLGRGVWERTDGNLYRRIYFKKGMSLIAVLSGVGQKKTTIAAQWLMAKKVCALISLGVAGGLDLTLRAGDTVFGDVIYQDQGGVIRRSGRGFRRWLALSGKGSGREE